MTEQPPATLADLIEALTALPSLDPVERARRCPQLIDAAKSVLSATRSRAMYDATAPGRPGRVSQVELAKRLGVVRRVVTDGVRQARARQEIGTT